MSRPLKVIMMGGRRCGKTAALASLFDQATNGPVKNYLTIADRTILEIKGLEKQDPLGGKTIELQNALEKNKNSSRTFMVDEKPTNNYWDYHLLVKIPGTNREMMIEFRDSAGECFVSSNTHSQETIEYVKDCDVFVIVVDTPFLMGPTHQTTAELCSEAICNGYNRVGDIQEFLTHIDDNEGKDAKMVIFVPLKCEKWAKETGGLERVSQRVEQVYATHIQNLKKYKKMHIAILPMQTAGNILFREFKKAYIYKGIKGVCRCCKIDERLIRIETGDPVIPKPGEEVIEDVKAIIDGANIRRPSAWYCVDSVDSGYKPHNCDQLPLHIIQFLLEKLIDAETRVKHKGIFGAIYDFFVSLIDRIKELFGRIDPEEMKKIIIQMKEDGVIKEAGEGIKIIKRL